jgi:hypothetical protein
MRWATIHREIERDFLAVAGTGGVATGLDR